MRYLVCYKCGGYYKLEHDESPDDFDYCSCGGELVYTDYLEGFLQEQKKLNAEQKFKQKISEEKLEESANKKSNQYYSNKEFIILLIGGFFLIIFFGRRFFIKSLVLYNFPFNILIFGFVAVIGVFLFLLGTATREY